MGTTKPGQNPGPAATPDHVTPDPRLAQDAAHHRARAERHYRKARMLEACNPLKAAAERAEGDIHNLLAGIALMGKPIPSYVDCGTLPVGIFDAAGEVGS